MGKEISDDHEAIEELTADNVRRGTALVQRGALHPAAWNTAVDAIRNDCFMEHVMSRLGGTEAVVAMALDLSGRLSHWLDEAEKEADKQATRNKLVVANGKIPHG